MLQPLICTGMYGAVRGGGGVRCTGGKAAARAGAWHGTSGREDTSPGAAYRVIL